MDFLRPDYCSSDREHMELGVDIWLNQPQQPAPIAAENSKPGGAKAGMVPLASTYITTSEVPSLMLYVEVVRSLVD